jgi:3-methyl-2-oxobutanoate hydroxymethyltransferase
MHVAGGFRATGRTEAEANQVVADAKAVAEAGAFAVVIEGTMAQVARKATEAVSVPTIGIGASAACDGQILVTDDMLGLFGGFTPRFVRRYADLSTIITQAAAEYARDVGDRRFPGPEHSFGMRDIKSA